MSAAPAARQTPRCTGLSAEIWWLREAAAGANVHAHGGWYAEPFAFFHRDITGDAEKIRDVSLNMIPNLNRDRARLS